jgi:hypothetical protein
MSASLLYPRPPASARIQQQQHDESMRRTQEQHDATMATIYRQLFP